MNTQLDEELQERHKWMTENLVDKNQARIITGQSAQGFLQSVNLGYIKPFFETRGETRATNRLYLISELEKYAKKKRE